MANRVCTIAMAWVVLGVASVTAQMTEKKWIVPVVGEQFPEFSLPDLDGSSVSLREELRHGPVVLIVLRGWPGYQCPFCTRQFGDFLSQASELGSRKATVLLVYPGSANGLKKHADEFRASRSMPTNFRFLIDSDFRWVSMNGFRWDAKNETSYPSTLLIDRHGTVRFSAMAKVHGARTSAKQVIEVLSEIQQD